jgi:hypothetical protein
VNAGDRTSWTLSVYLENRISASPKLKVGTDRIDEQCSADAEYRWPMALGMPPRALMALLRAHTGGEGSDRACKGTVQWASCAHALISATPMRSPRRCVCRRLR